MPTIDTTAAGLVSSLEDRARQAPGSKVYPPGKTGFYCIVRHGAGRRVVWYRNHKKAARADAVNALRGNVSLFEGQP